MKVKEKLLAEKEKEYEELSKARGEKKVELHEKMLRGGYKNERL